MAVTEGIASPNGRGTQRYASLRQGLRRVNSPIGRVDSFRLGLRRATSP